MVTKAGRRTARLIYRIDKEWNKAMKRLPDHLQLYHLKVQLQDYVTRRGREAILEELRSWGGADEEIIAWLLDTPATVEDALDKSRELKIAPEARTSSDCDDVP